MYRFNEQDRRLARLVSLVIMVMESLAESAEMQEKYHYSIVGHSGDDAWIDLGVDFGAPPPTAKERYGEAACEWLCVCATVDNACAMVAAVVRKMLAHSEYCQVRHVYALVCVLLCALLCVDCDCSSPAITHWKVPSRPSSMWLTRRRMTILFLLSVMPICHATVSILASLVRS